MPRYDEICFEAPEINMASEYVIIFYLPSFWSIFINLLNFKSFSIVLDARVSVVTVAKLVDIQVPFTVENLRN